MYKLEEKKNKKAIFLLPNDTLFLDLMYVLIATDKALFSSEKC